MPIRLRVALDFFSDAIDKIMLIAGFLCLIISLVFFTRAFQWFSLAVFLSGVLLIIVGAILHSGSFSLKFPSIDGWGTILMCASVVCLASAVVFFLFAVPGSFVILPAGFRSWSEKIIVINLERPMSWLAPILVWTGLGLMATGFLLKIIRDIV